MTTRRKKAIKKEITVVDHDGHDIVEEEVVEEVVIEKTFPQLYQSLVTVSHGGPHEPIVPVGHIQYLDRTGELTAIPHSSRYAVDLEALVSGGLISKKDSSVVFSPRTKEWLLNLHDAILPRNWKATEATSRDEI